MVNPFQQGIDPITFGKLLWPKYSLYTKQREIVYSVQENVRTVVPAGNMLGVQPPLLWLVS